MPDGRLNFQRALYQLLKNDPTLAGEGNKGVFDFVPDNQAFPYVRIGDIEWVDFSTHTEDGFEGTCTIHTWSRPVDRGRRETLILQGIIYSLLHRSNLAIENYANVSLRFVSSNILVDPDNVTVHGIQVFRLLIAGRVKI